MTEPTADELRFVLVALSQQHDDGKAPQLFTQLDALCCSGRLPEVWKQSFVVNAAEVIEKKDAELSVLRDRCAGLEGALRSLVDKLDECKPHVSGAFQMAYLSRGRDYTGPTYGEEHEAARAALAGSSAPATDPQHLPAHEVTASTGNTLGAPVPLDQATVKQPSSNAPVPAEGAISGGVSFKDGAWTYASKEAGDAPAEGQA